MMHVKMTILALSLGLCAIPGAMAQERPPQNRPPRGPQPRDDAKRYSIEQAVSDQAQLHTIAFDGLAFLTGDFGMDTFLPPGKVSDYFGFQYMRDIDAREGGHNTSFLTRIADNMLAILDDNQKAQLLALAKEQENDIKQFAEKRLPLIKAFRRNLEGDLPTGSKGLDKGAVVKYSASLYELDGQLSFARAKVMGTIIRSLSAPQKAALTKLKFGDSRTWPDQPDQLDKRSMSHEVNVAMMTYTSEMFAWYAGSLEADTYFCPERHGMYFGGFGMKTAPAMGKQDYSISTSLTGNSGESFLATLNTTQRKLITVLVALQRRDLAEIVKTRRAIATELRRFIKGEAADKDKVMALSKRYGELDGEMSYLYATAFAKAGRTLTAQQKAKLASLRTTNPADPKGPFLYSSPIDMPEIENTDFLFGMKRQGATAPPN
jgi:Spy/CpxP family protein refolding chaperone